MNNLQRTKDPLIAIVMATYKPNKEFFIKQIQSIKEQSYKNWICIIIDDCSPDQSYEWISTLLHEDKRFQIYKNNQNLGPYYTFEQGLLKVKDEAKFIAFCDQDDFWLPEKLDTLVEQLQKNPSAKLIHSDLQTIDENDTIIQSSCWKHENRSVDQPQTELLLLRNTVTGCSMMFDKEILDLALPFPKISNPFPKFILHDLWIALSCSLNGSVEICAKPFVLYRQHSSNSIGSIKKENPIIKVIKKIFKIGSLKTIIWILATSLLTLESRELLLDNLQKRFLNFKAKPLPILLIQALVQGYNLHTVPVIILIGYLLKFFTDNSFKEFLRKSY